MAETARPLWSHRPFHKSGEHNDELLRYEGEDNSSVMLVVDVRTRWNSTLRMLKNFLRLRGAVSKYFDALPRKRGTFPFTDAELEQLEEVASCQAHVEEASERLSAADINMRMAHLALEVG